MKRPDILFCIDSLHNGGAEKILIEYLTQLGHNMNIFLLVLCDYGVYFDSIPTYVRHGVWAKMSCEERENFNFIHFDIEVAFLEGLAARFIYKRRRNTIKVCWVHTDMNANNWCADYFDKGEQRRCYESMNHIVFVSENSAREFCHAFFHPVSYRVFHNCIDYTYLDRYVNVPKSSAHGVFTICAAGRFVPEKRFELLVDSIAELKKIIPNGLFSVCILGDGPERENLMKRIEEKKLENSIFLPGFQKEPYNCMRNADVFISTSRVEGESLVLKEACYLGVPIVSTDSGGNSELLAGMGCGILVQADYKEIASVLAILITHPDLLEKERKKIDRKRIKDYADISKIRDWLSDLCVDNRRSSIGMGGVMGDFLRSKPFNSTYAVKKIGSICMCLERVDYPWNYDTGLAGFGIGLMTLSRRKSIAFNIESVLQHIDNVLCTSIVQQVSDNLHIRDGISGIGIYLFYRLSTLVTEEQKERRNYLLEHVVYLIIWIEALVRVRTYFEPKDSRELLYVLGLLKRLNLITFKITDIVTDIESKELFYES